MDNLTYLTSLNLHNSFSRVFLPALLPTPSAPAPPLPPNIKMTALRPGLRTVLRPFHSLSRLVPGHPSGPGFYLLQLIPMSVLFFFPFPPLLVLPRLLIFPEDTVQDVEHCEEGHH